MLLKFVLSESFVAVPMITLEPSSVFVKSSVLLTCTLVSSMSITSMLLGATLIVCPLVEVAIMRSDNSSSVALTVHSP